MNTRAFSQRSAKAQPLPISQGPHTIQADMAPQHASKTASPVWPVPRISTPIARRGILVHFP
eukprot:9153044-Heterocapsa_arctica.AAC.1